MSACSPQACTAGFTDALIRRDMASALALLTQDVVFFYSNGTTISGREPFASIMTASWKVLEKYQYEASELRWISQSDEFAAVIYRFAWCGMAGAQAVSGRGRGTRVLQKTRESGWLIAHEHLSGGQWAT